MPPGTKGNMAAVSAEGQGNRFIVIAVETNEPVPVTDPGTDCKKVAFSGGAVRGTVESSMPRRSTAPRLWASTASCRPSINGQPRTGEVYNYSAHFGDYQVIVTANPLVVPDKPLVPVNTERAGELLVAGVKAVRG